MLSRETTIGCIAALLLTFTAWTWGGVILWAQWTTAALGLLTLSLALLPSSSPSLSTTTSSSPHPATLPLLLSALLGLLTFLGVAGFDLWSTLSLRDATLLLIPSATLPPLTFSDWSLRASLIGLFSALLVPIIFGLIKPSERRRRLLRFLPFWLGLFLFAWITCQSLNPWGVVVQRDLFWRILPQDHIAWLPSGLDAPFAASEEPGGMNGWRQLLILIGPWALLCALIATSLSRRAYGWLAILTVVNGLGIIIAGNLARSEKWREFLGFAAADSNIPPFGPFVYKNHAGAYLYLIAALALALTFYLAKRRGDKVDRGGPHLITALGFVFLVLGSASTMSIGALIAVAALTIIVAPACYLFDLRLRTNLSPLPALAIVILTAAVGYAGLLSTDAKKWRYKVESKQKSLEQTGFDDRAPLRQVTWSMVENVSWERNLSGWGAGSYRWTSPTFLAQRSEFLNKRGQLIYRATHAHNDWLQAIVEWGFAGWVVVVGALTFIALRIRAQIQHPRAPALALLGGLLLFSAHIFIDFLLFLPQLSLLAVLVAWLMTLESAEDTVDARRAGKS